MKDLYRFERFLAAGDFPFVELRFCFALKIGCASAMKTKLHFCFALYSAFTIFALK